MRVVVFAAVAAISFGPCDRAERRAATRESAHEEPAETLTMAKYSAIQTGMTYAQVAAIVGREGQEVSRSQLGALTTVMYMWKTDRRAAGNMSAMFQNDALVTKSQFGLK